MRHRQAIRTSRSGAAAVELALTAPILLLLVFGIVEFGWLFMARQMVHHAASEAADRSVLPGFQNTENGWAADSELELLVEDLLLDSLRVDAGAVDLLRNPATAGDDPCEMIQVVVPVEEVMLPGFVLGLFDIDERDIEFVVTRGHPSFVGVQIGVTCDDDPPPT